MVEERAALNGSDLTPDCESCSGLCCVAPGFSASPEFGVDKPPGVACPHLGAGFRCDIHERLASGGFPGCIAYDCYGAGQKVTQLTFGGRDWRRSPEITAGMFESFMVMRRLHEQLMLLSEALKLGAARPLYDDLRRELEKIEGLTQSRADALGELDVSALETYVEALLLRVGDLVRASETP